MDIKALNQRWFQEVWNEGRAETIDELFSPNVITHGLGPDGGDMVGSEGFKAFHKKFRDAFPNMVITVDDTLTDGDRCACRFSGWAMHEGESLGVPATGRRVTFTGMTFTRWANGQIVEGWNNVDIMGILKQVDAL